MRTKIAGRYQLIREIGSGGMGRVFQALDTETGHTVAAKILIGSEEVDLQALIRFQNEGAVLSTLKHPNIVQVFSTHLEEHTSCIIMEFLEGQSLGQILQRQRLPLARVKHLMQQVASALAFAHSRAIVHRDVKPDNIMVLGNELVKVTDFGIARILQEGAVLNTKKGTTVGTPSYMSPEQIDGSNVDGRSDIYSFGCVMYQMVTGRPPFEGEDPLAVAFQHVHKDPRPPRDLKTELSDEWEALILRTLAKDPAQRYQSAETLAEAVIALPVPGQVGADQQVATEAVPLKGRGRAGIDVVMPCFHEMMETGFIAKWLKEEGDEVKKGDVLVEIETSKVNMELECQVDGTVSKIVVREGDSARVGDVLAVIAPETSR